MRNWQDPVFLSSESYNLSLRLPTSALLYLHEREISFYFVKAYFGLHYFLHPSITLSQFLCLQPSFGKATYEGSPTFALMKLLPVAWKYLVTSCVNLILPSRRSANGHNRIYLQERIHSHIREDCKVTNTNHIKYHKILQVT